MISEINSFNEHYILAEIHLCSVPKHPCNCCLCPHNIQAELQGGVLFWVLRWGEQTAELSVWVGLSYCDGGWNTLNVLKRGPLASAGLNGVYEQDRKGIGGPLTISSPLYLGGVPPGVKHPALNKHSLLHG